jgi:hypothetical protein
LTPDGGATLFDSSNKRVGTFSTQSVGPDSFKATLVRANGTQLNSAFTVSSLGSGVKIVGTVDGQPFDISYDGNGKALPGSHFPQPSASDRASAQALQEAFNTRVQMHAELTDACKLAIVLLFIGALEGPVGFAVAAIFYWHTCHK